VCGGLILGLGTVTLKLLKKGFKSIQQTQEANADVVTYNEGNLPHPKQNHNTPKQFYFFKHK